MKSREGFVSNSSSSSFIIPARIVDKYKLTARRMHELIYKLSSVLELLHEKPRGSLNDQVDEWLWYEEQENGCLRVSTTYDGSCPEFITSFIRNELHGYYTGR